MKLEQYILKDDGQFPNSELPVLVYKAAIRLPFFLKAAFVRNIFKRHHWTNNWKDGVYTFHHYHSNTHEVMAVIKGSSIIQLGGEKGIHVKVEKGDVLLIPAGVAHCNLGKKKDLICVGGYPGGVDYDMNYGKKAERPAADKKIAKVKMPRFDPVTGKSDPLHKIWNSFTNKHSSK
jgi:uncharacterized protein YjlB